MSESVAFWFTIVVFVLTYAGLAIGRLPWLRTDRPGIALAGAALMLASGLLTFDEAVSAVDFATLVLLLGMMIVVAYLRRGGLFATLAGLALGRVRHPAGLLAVTMALSGVLSALLVNDVVCLALTPLVLHLARHLRLDPRPHLIGLAVASNAGSVATLTGNPQNMIIGGLSHISYLRFAAKLAPVALLSLAAAYLVTWFVFRGALRPGGMPVESKPSKTTAKQPRRRQHRSLLVKSLAVTLVAVGLFFAGFPMAIVALGAAAILLLDRVNPANVYRQIDWSLLVMFAGLFVVVHAFEMRVLSRWDAGQWSAIRDQPVVVLSGVSAFLSNIVSNVPAVLLFKPIIPELPAGSQESAWLALAMSSTLAGNLTVLGSVANLIVVEYARKEGVIVTLADYCRVGIPVTILTLLIGIAWLLWVPY
ncbi:anion transporter [Zavarzinella formosa]|uniref:anion transporter n=1 Tax=Zavarzinella formosa TaxID=360055 RepID=UPI0002D9DD07|nr:anion transporter [Zavarzinella formosa]